MNSTIQQAKALSLVLFLFFTILARSQEVPIEAVLNSTDTTFEQICAKFDTFFAENGIPGESDGDDNFYQRYQKWAYFWRSRLNKNGVPNRANTLLDIDNFNLCDTDADKHIEWGHLGPHNSDNSFVGGGGFQNQGMIISVSPHPDDAKDILVGGINGGIWRTTNADANPKEITWANTTYDEGYTIVGVDRFARHPDDGDIVYAGTGVGFGLWGWGRDYGIGVLVSTDGGNDWVRTGMTGSIIGQGEIRGLIVLPSSTKTGNNTTIFAATRHAIHRWVGNTQAGGSWTEIIKNTGMIFNDLRVDSDDRIWVGTSQGLFTIEPGQSTLTAFTYTIPSKALEKNKCYTFYGFCGLMI